MPKRLEGASNVKNYHISITPMETPIDNFGGESLMAS